MLRSYEKFLEVLTLDLNDMFEHQKDYIFCKEGCSYCCESGEYPFTDVEFDYLMEGYNKLDEETKKIIRTNFKNIVKDEKGYYTCPFLINKKCSVYFNRALICRTFGLINLESDGRISGPFCGKMGLNYSNVYDPDTKRILPENIAKNNFKSMPKVFNLSISNIRKLDFIKQLGIEFGEQKSLYEFLENCDEIKKP